MAEERPGTEVIAANLTQPSLPLLLNLKTVQSTAEEDWTFIMKIDFNHVQICATFRRQVCILTVL